MSVAYMTHPLIKHKITMLRKETTGTNEFRKIVEEIAILMGYEALSDLPTRDVLVKSPIEESMQPEIDGKKLAVVPILRAGLGMVNGILALVPSAKVGHIGLYRDPETHEPHEYYCKLPENIDERTIVVVDPMLATGGSAEDQVHVHHRRSRGRQRSDEGASRHPALRRQPRQTAQRERLYLPRSRRRGRQNLRHAIIFPHKKASRFRRIGRFFYQELISRSIRPCCRFRRQLRNMPCSPRA